MKPIDRQIIINAVRASAAREWLARMFTTDANREVLTAAEHALAKLQRVTEAEEDELATRSGREHP
jgi:hypothetical protein